jgi:hypothetical protein
LASKNNERIDKVLIEPCWLDKKEPFGNKNDITRSENCEVTITMENFSR